MKYIILICLILGAYWSIGYMTQSINKDLQLKAKEAKCIAKYVSLEIERANIITSKGKCYIRD